MTENSTIEIERKFKVDYQKAQDITLNLIGQEIEQFYIGQNKDSVLRVRIVNNKKAFLTLKGPKEKGQGLEFEYEIPLDHALKMKALQDGKSVLKTRYEIPLEDGLTAELDLFQSPKKFALIEVEIPSIETVIKKPNWFGEDVTENFEFSNYFLAFNS